MFRLFRFPVAIAAITVSLCATAQAPNANTDIVKMIQAGLPESVIVNKIHEGLGRWDTSVDALVALKQAGATGSELDAITTQPAPSPAPLAAAAPPPASIPAFGGMLGYTATGVPYIQFPAGVLIPTLTGEPSNRIFLMRDGGKPLVVIPSSFASINNETVPTGLHFASVFIWSSSLEGNLLWSTSEVRFEDLCLIPDTGAGIKDKAEREKLRENPGPLLDQFFADKKQVVRIEPPLAFREKQSLYYLGTVGKKDKLIGYVFTVGLQGYTWAGRENEQPANAQYRSPELQGFIDKLIQHPEETIAEFARAANLPPDASLWSSSLDYIYSTKEAARHYGNVNANFVAELKSRQPPQPAGNGFGSFMNVMQGVTNIAQAQRQANIAAVNHDMSGQLNAAMSAGKAEAQTLDAISNPNAAAIQPLAPADPNAIQNTTNQQLTSIQVKQAQVQAQKTAQQRPQQIASAKTSPSLPVNAHAKPVADSGTAPPPTCVDLGPGNCMPIAQYQQLQAQKKQQGVVLDTLCPASGFVPGVMTHPSPDVALGVQCKPGSAIYINGVPQFDTTGTGLNPVTNNTGIAASRTDGPSEAACIERSSDPTDSYPVFHNICSFAVTYFWTPFRTPPGGYAEQNGILQPGETQTGAETAVGGYRIYVCQTNYLVRGPDGSPITGVVNGFRCVKP